ncbi:hypothetical protein P0136_00175 [Lentisphaerota bacterium ZTH]|nr:hypothetical protein JYG24_08680 [Lentisphaerota bacterium]WET06432.1 hypothetical protein P0136_00175 [Lentisphaerota bacterium ZTH]
MPIDKKNTLALSWALVDSIRKHIPYSSNLPALDAWYKYPDSYGEKNKALVKLKSLETPVEAYRHQLETRSRFSAAADSGYCEKLVQIALALLSMTKLKNVETLYASQVYTTASGGREHTFLLLHSSPALFCRPRENQLITMNFYSFLQKCSEEDAVTICDPGIWLAAEGADVKSVFEQAKAYGVSEYYKGALLHKYSVRLIDLNSPEKARLSWATLQRENFCSYQKVFAKLQRDFVNSYEKSAFAAKQARLSKSSEIEDIQSQLHFRQNFDDSAPGDQKKSCYRELFEFVMEAQAVLSHNVMTASSSQTRIQSLQKISSYCSNSTAPKKPIDNLLRTALLLIMLPVSSKVEKQKDLPQYVNDALLPLIKSDYQLLNDLISTKIKRKLETPSQIYDYLNLDGHNELFTDALKVAVFSEADNLVRVL